MSRRTGRRMTQVSARPGPRAVPARPWPRLAAGVAIVSTLDDGKPRGLLVSSLTSLSVEPPRVLFCVAKTAGSHDPLARADRCGLSVLSDRHAEEAERFSSIDRGAERFTSAAWRLAPKTPPLHHGALLGRIGGPISRDGSTPAATRSSILDVETIETSDAGPLIYFDRAFRSLGVEPRGTTSAQVQHARSRSIPCASHRASNSSSAVGRPRRRSGKQCSRPARLTASPPIRTVISRSSTPQAASKPPPIS